MRQIDTSTATAIKPTPPAAGTAKFFQDTDPSGGTKVPAWFLNSLQDEIINAIVAGGLTPDKANDTQLAAAIVAIAQASVTGMIYSGATVFSGSMPTSFTDLDLSGIIGANRCFVHIGVESDVDAADVRIKTKGQSQGVAGNDSLNAGGTNLCEIDSGNIGEFSLITDASGVVEWKSSGAGSGGTIVKLLVYEVLG